MVKAEPDPAVRDEPIVLKKELSTGMLGTLREDIQPEVAPLAEMAPLDLTMFPPGANLKAIAAVEKAAREEEAQERQPKKRHIPGESNERPE